MTNPFRNDDGTVKEAEPVKQKVEVVPTATPDPVTGASAQVVVVKEKPGTVTVWDRLKNYYHTVITVTGALLIFLNQVTPLTDSLGATAQHWITGVVLALTAVLNLLKSNEKWVDGTTPTQ